MRILGYLTLICLGITASYLIAVIACGVVIYQHIVLPDARYESTLYASDDSLGFKPIPNSSGILALYEGDTVPIRFDGNGFRIPYARELSENVSDSVDILFLGCSFTFGYGCLAEDTYPYLISESLGMSYINASVSAYGLSQMYLLAKRLIPLYKPRFVVFQRSSWLPYRGLSPFNRVDQGLLTVPYFSDSGESPVLQYPIERSLVFDLVDAKENGEFNHGFLRFLFGFAFSHIVKEHYLYLSTMARLLANPELRPAKDVAKVEQAVYQRMTDIAIANSVFPIVLNVGFRWNDAPELLLQGEGLWPLTINADSLLVEQLGIGLNQNPSPEEYDLIYDKAYSHWRVNGKDSTLIDTHPNEAAHRLISKLILSQVRF